LLRAEISQDGDIADLELVDAQSNWQGLRWPLFVNGSTSLTCSWDNLLPSIRKYRSTISFGRETSPAEYGRGCNRHE
jgi:hypothetical protein